MHYVFFPLVIHHGLILFDPTVQLFIVHYQPGTSETFSSLPSKADIDLSHSSNGLFHLTIFFEHCLYLFSHDVALRLQLPALANRLSPLPLLHLYHLSLLPLQFGELLVLHAHYLFNLFDVVS